VRRNEMGGASNTKGGDENGERLVGEKTEE
jgi:hypothetical protein